MNVHDEMSDADVLRAAADSLSTIPMPSAPDAAAIITTGRARRRRRMTGLSIAGTAAVTVVALGLSGVFGSASHEPGYPAHARLAAWTVTKLADGNISVTINQFNDPAGLQSTLRADGVPASVTLPGQQNPACQPYPGGTPGPASHLATPLLKQVFPKPYQRLALLPQSGHPSAAPAPSSSNSVVIVIDRSALPSNSGVQLGYVGPGQRLLLPRVVYASAQCTGS
jgi:hypothetical protein